MAPALSSCTPPVSTSWQRTRSAWPSTRPCSPPARHCRVNSMRFNGTKRLRHPAIGELDLAYEALELPGNDGLTILTYSAAGDPSGDGLELLAAWAATQQSVTAQARG
ncbi:hypothetical protein ACIA5D_30820 [Actinoplanes sp. NPDC051513]|uniref:MmyB family transcriptional regulator n=1 Tax=Actinoplanes sp. NPDC051513 TaxID=3363908 RepID=UPI00379BD227